MSLRDTPAMRAKTAADARQGPTGYASGSQTVSRLGAAASSQGSRELSQFSTILFIFS